MPDKQKTPSKAERSKPEEPGYETVDAPFETIIDAILEANPEAVKVEGRRRRVRKR